MYVFHKAILDIWNVENVPAVEYEWESLNGLKWQGLRGTWRPTSYIATFSIGARSTITSWVNLNLTTHWFRSNQMGLMEIIISGAYKRGGCRDCNIVIIGAKDTGDCNEWKCLESVVDGLLLDFFWTFKNPIEPFNLKCNEWKYLESVASSLLALINQGSCIISVQFCTFSAVQLCSFATLQLCKFAVVLVQLWSCAVVYLSRTICTSS